MSHWTSSQWGPRLLVLLALAWGVGVLRGFATGLELVTVVGFVSAIAGVFYAPLGILGAGILATVDTVTRAYIMTGGLFRWNTFNYWLLLFTAINLPRLLRTNDIHTKLLLGLSAITLSQLALSENLENGVQHSLGLISSFGLLLYYVRAVWDPRMWFWLATVNGVVAALGGAVFFLDGAVSQMNENAWSLFPVSGLFSICLGFDSARSRYQQAFLFLLAGMNTVWVYLIGSRGSMFICFVALLFLFLKVRSTLRRVAYVGVCLPVVLVILVRSSNLADNATHRLEKLFDSDFTWSERTSGRSTIALIGIRSFLDHPLGIGTGNFGQMYARANDTDFRQGHVAQAHAAYIKVLAETGLIGITLFLAYLGSFAYVGWRKRHEQLLLTGLLTTLALAVSFLSTEFQAKGIWFLATGTTVLLHRRIRIVSIQPAGYESLPPGTFRQHPVFSTGAAAGFSGR